MSRRVEELGADQARRIAVRAQLLAGPATDRDPVEVVEHLAGVQVDLTDVVAPSGDLVLRARCRGHRPGDLDDLRAAGVLVEHRARLLPADLVALLRPDMDCWPGGEDSPWAGAAAWVARNAAGRHAILEALRGDGPLTARELPDACVEPWRSSGWSNAKNVVKMLECLEHAGEVAVASREGRERHWDLTERVHPDVEPLDREQAHREHAARRLAALGICRPRRIGADHEPYDLSEVGTTVRVAGVRGTWRVDPGALATADEPVGASAHALSPLDRLVFDRARALELFAFDYQLEMYKPAAARRWGYWAMPLLVGDRLVGKLDATAEVSAGLLHVDAIHRDGAWDADTAAAVEAEVDALARWLGLTRRDA